MIQSAIDCEDKFFSFEYNKVYTVSNFIDLYHKGTNRGRFLGIKEITNTACDSKNYKFPTNDGVRNFDIIFVLINFLLVLLTYVAVPLIPTLHFCAALFPIFKLMYIMVYTLIAWPLYFLCKIVDIILDPRCNKPKSPGQLWANLRNPFRKITLPSITYPDCELCSCAVEYADGEQGTAYASTVAANAAQSFSCTIDTQVSTAFANVFDFQYCYDDPFILPPYSASPCSYIAANGCGGSQQQAFQDLLAGSFSQSYVRRTTPPTLASCNTSTNTYSSQDITLSERINLFNLKGKFFDSLATQGGGANQIKVKIRPDLNPTKFHYDNVIALLIDEGCSETFIPGSLLSFSDDYLSKDPNLKSGNTISYVSPDGDVVNANSVPGNPINLNTVIITCANPNGSGSLTTSYQVDQSSGVTQVLIPNTQGQVQNISDDSIGSTATDGTYNGITGNQNGSYGIGLTFNVIVQNGSVTNVSINTPGYNYNVDEYITILGQTIGGTVDDTFNIVITQVSVQQYVPKIIKKFRTDIEYFQVITSTTYSEFCSLNPTPPTGNYYTTSVLPSVRNSFRYRYTDNFSLIQQECLIGGPGATRKYIYPTYDSYRPIYAMSEQKNFRVVFMVRGVDPHSTRQTIEYDLSRLFGKTYGQGPVVKGEYKLNVPIQPGLTIPRHNLVTNNNTQSEGQYLFYPSFLYQTTSDFSGFTTNLHSYYSSLDKTSINNFEVTPGAGPGGTFTKLNSSKVNSSVTSPVYLSAANNDTNLYSRSTYFFDGGLFPGTSGTRVCSVTSTNQGGAFSIDNNSTHFINPSTGKEHRGYYAGEYIEGGSYMYGITETDSVSIQIQTPLGGAQISSFNWQRLRPDFYCYFAPTYSTATTLTFLNGSVSNRTVMRTDRLPTSTELDKFDNNSFALAQNARLKFYTYTDDGDSAGISLASDNGGYLSNDYADDGLSDFENSISQTFSCEGLVPYSCYQGSGENFDVKPVGDTCYDTPSIVRNGCYILIDGIPFARLGKDYRAFAEWKTRFKVNLAACRGVFGHTFVNNWINGTLFAFPIKNKRFFTSPLGSNPNQPYNKFCTDTVMLHPKTNNFYYRSTPYSIGAAKFYGRPAPTSGRNSRQLLFPTTIMDLGPRDEFSYQLILSENYYGYNMGNLTTTSYQDISDILNLFLVSRQISSTFLQRLFSAKDASVDTFFSRKKSRFDGDYTQMISINSEFGVDGFNYENYDYVTGNTTTANNTFYLTDQTIGIFFSSDTQIRDYITPRRIIRDDTTQPGIYDNLPIFTQEVPMYKWNIAQTTSTIFGSQANDWATTIADIGKYKYQTLDRLNALNGGYFMGQVNIPIFQKGFIFNVKPDPNGNGFLFEGDTGTGILINTRKVTVGAPFHFYFGLSRGGSALDKYNKKYLGVETI